MSLMGRGTEDAGQQSKYIIETSLTIGHRDKIQQWLEKNVYWVYKAAIKKAREEREQEY